MLQKIPFPQHLLIRRAGIRIAELFRQIPLRKQPLVRLLKMVLEVVEPAAIVVLEVANQYQQAFRNSCQDAGGTWEFLDRLIDRLRLIDLRFGYNGRRGDPNFVGRDEVAYHYGAGASANSRDVYVWDVIAGHCGSNPQPNNLDMTEFGGIWLTRGRF